MARSRVHKRGASLRKSLTFPTLGSGEESNASHNGSSRPKPHISLLLRVRQYDETPIRLTMDDVSREDSGQDSHPGPELLTGPKSQALVVPVGTLEASGLRGFGFLVGKLGSLYGL